MLIPVFLLTAWIGSILLTLRMGETHLSLSREALVREAVSQFENIIIMRQWNAERGGVYVRPLPGESPNPYLKDGSLRTGNGEILIRVNPAWMTRQLSEISSKESDHPFRILSLNPLNPGNKPADGFEKRALAELEKDPLRRYYYEFNENQMDLMGALITKKECLACHAHQGYKIGDVRGGIHISVPLNDYKKSVGQVGRDRVILLGFFTVLFLMIALLSAYAAGTFRRRVREQETVSSSLREQVSEKTAELAAVMDCAGEGIYVVDTEERLIYMNPYAEKLLGYSLTELAGKRMHDVIHNHSCINDVADSEQCPVHTAITEQKPYYSENECFFTKEGLVIPVAMTAAPLLNEGVLRGSVTVFQDITLRKAHMRMLEDMNRELEARVASETAQRREQEEIMLSKSKFVAMAEMMQSVAHHWRQPLNNIALMVQNLPEMKEAGELSSEELDRISSGIMGEISHLSRTIDEFRDLFRTTWSREVLSAYDGIRQILDVFCYASAFYKNRIHVYVGRELKEIDYSKVKGIPEYEDVYYYGIAAEFRHVILNILNNAMEAFASGTMQPGSASDFDKGKIIIRIQPGKTEGIIEIEDEAGGVPEGHREKVFDPFYSTRHGNSGMGLYISRIITEKNLKGSIEIHHPPGRTLVRIRLPSVSSSGAVFPGEQAG